MFQITSSLGRALTRPQFSAFAKQSFLVARFHNSAQSLGNNETPTHFKLAQRQHEYVKKASSSKKEEFQYEAPPHHIWTQEEVDAISITHKQPKALHEKMANKAINVVRKAFDYFSGYNRGITEQRLLYRVIFLETVAGIPGIVAGTLRHLRSLRRMQRDYGWIQTLYAEAENERMHMLCFMQLKQPGLMFRGMVLMAQGVFWNMFFVAYLISPKFCHSFVGFLEEEAVKTYTGAIEALDNGKLPNWAKMEAPPIAKKYWALGDNAMMRDVLLAVRADEANHRDVNHGLSEAPLDAPNPFLGKN